MNGVYIHIPFCERKCQYCAFSSFCDLEEKDRYINHLINEIYNFNEEKLAQNKNYIYKNSNLHDIDTIYIGGGTPSLLAIEDIEKILNAVNGKFNLQKNYEITIECNPNSLTEDKIKSYKNLGINRLSIGVQSLNDKQLSFLGRLHNSKQALDAIILSTKYFDNVSCDFLIGIPNQNAEEVVKNIEEVIKKGVKHISTYMLQVEEGSPLLQLIKRNPFLLPDDDECVDIYQKTINFLQKNSFLQYEISNLAQKGYESKHNLKYWSGENYIGFGLSAHSYINGVRYANGYNFKDYYEHKNAIKEVLTKEQLIEEHIMLGLRCTLGVNIEYLKNLGYNIEKNKNFNEFLSKNIIFKKENKFFLNPQYYGVSNYIIVKLLKD